MTRSHPAPPEVQAEWRAAGAWTDETLLDRLASADGTRLALVDGDTRLTVDDVRAYAKRLIETLGAFNGGFIAQWYASPQAVEHSQEKIDAMIQASRDAGTKLGVIFQRRTSPLWHKVKKV